MSKINKLVLKILSAKSDNNIRFEDLLYLLNFFNFTMRIKGSHHILTRENIKEIVNIQSLSNGMAKNYQVKQIRNLLIDYKLVEFDNEQI